MLYDGICNLCTGAVRFLNALDRTHAVEFAPYQKLGLDERKSYGLSTSELKGGMHIVRGDGPVVRGAAAIAEACRLLAPIISVCELFNTPLAQELYGFIARRRYKLFGCRDSCYIPSVREVPR